MVLRRFEETPAFLRDEEDKGLVRTVVLDVVREAGVAGVFLTPDGLVTDVLEILDDGLIVVGFASVAGVALVVGWIKEALELLLGFADRPSVFSSLASGSPSPSTELNEERLVWAGVLTVAVPGGFRAAGIVDRTGGLLSDVAVDVFAADVEVGFESVDVDIRGATGVVSGLLGRALLSVRDEDRSAMMGDNL